MASAQGLCLVVRVPAVYLTSAIWANLVSLSLRKINKLRRFNGTWEFNSRRLHQVRTYFYSGSARSTRPRRLSGAVGVLALGLLLDTINHEFMLFPFWDDCTGWLIPLYPLPIFKINRMAGISSQNMTIK